MSSTKSRKDTRAVVVLRARYRSPATFEYVQEACTDVSVGGMFIKSDSPVAAGTLIKLECETDGDGAKIRGVARVVWLRLEANEHGPTGMGVKFVKLESGSKDVIAKLVQRLADQGVQARSISAPPEATAGGPAASTVGSAAPGSTSASPAAARRSAPAIGISAAPTAGLSSSPSARALGAAKISSKPAPAAIGQMAQPVTHAVAEPSSRAAAASVSEPAAALAPAQPAAQPAAAAVVEPEPPTAAAPQPTAAATQPTAAAASAAARMSEGDSGEMRTVKKSGSGMVWVGLLIGVGVLLAIIFADDSANTPPAARSESQPATASNEPSAPSPGPAANAPTAVEAPPSAPAAAEPTTVPPNEPAAAPAEPKAGPTPAPQPAPAPASAAPANARNAAAIAANPKKAAANAHAADSPPIKPEPAAAAEPTNDKPVVNIVPEPAAQTDTPAAAPAAAAAPEAAPAAPAEPAPPPQAAGEPKPASGDAAPGDYVVEFVSKPSGATISIGDKSLVTPGEINLGSVMPKRVRVGASKDGYLPSSAWVDNTGFKRTGGVFRKRVYMSLPFEDPASEKPARNR